LSEETGQQYRLPSEADWEYACRAGTTTRYHVGNTIHQHQARYSESMIGRIGSLFGLGAGNGTKPVGQYPGNAFGLFDMHGNVCEWCADIWDDNYRNAPQDGSACNEIYYHGGIPLEGFGFVDSESEYRALRGGGWCYIARACRSASRHGNQPYGKLGGSGEVIGFRCARVLS